MGFSLEKELEKQTRLLQCINVATTAAGDNSTLEAILEQILLAIQMQPQLEGLNFRPICYDDAGTIRKGERAVIVDEETGALVFYYLDYNGVQTSTLTVVECEEAAQIFITDAEPTCN